MLFREAGNWAPSVLRQAMSADDGQVLAMLADVGSHVRRAGCADQYCRNADCYARPSKEWEIISVADWTPRILRERARAVSGERAACPLLKRGRKLASHTASIVGLSPMTATPALRGIKAAIVALTKQFRRRFGARDPRERGRSGWMKANWRGARMLGR